MRNTWEGLEGRRKGEGPIMTFFNFRIIQIVQSKHKFVFIQKPGNKTAKFKLVFCENKIPTCNFFI